MMRVLALALLLAGCVTHDGPVTITRTINVGPYRACLSEGIGVLICEHIRIDPASCAMVIIYPKPPTPGVLAALKRLGNATRAVCLASKEPSP